MSVKTLEELVTRLQNLRRVDTYIRHESDGINIIELETAEDGTYVLAEDLEALIEELQVDATMFTYRKAA